MDEGERCRNYVEFGKHCQKKFEEFCLDSIFVTLVDISLDNKEQVKSDSVHNAWLSHRDLKVLGKTDKCLMMLYLLAMELDLAGRLVQKRPEQSDPRVVVGGFEEADIRLMLQENQTFHHLVLTKAVARK